MPRMHKALNIFAIMLGLAGALLEFFAARRVESRFTADGVVLGYGPEYMTYFWRHCAEIGFVLIAVAFVVELVAIFSKRS